MSNAADRLAKDRTTREAALSAFNANLAQVRTDLEARGIGGRIADQASMEVRAGIDENSINTKKATSSRLLF